MASFNAQTPNKLTSKTPLEPGAASSAIKNDNSNNNVTEDDKFLDETDHKTFGKEVINRKRTLSSFTNQEPFEPETSSTINKNVPQDDEFGDDHSKTVLDGKSKIIKIDDEPQDDEFGDDHSSTKTFFSAITEIIKIDDEPQDDEFGDDHSKTVLDGKSKIIKTDDGKKRIKCQETPLEPGASSSIKTNVPEDDKLLDEPKPWPFKLKRLKKYYDHDHNICVASELGLAYGDLIPGEYAKYFDEKAMVPKIKLSPAEWKLAFDADYNSFDPCDPWKYPPIEPAGNLFSSSSSSSFDDPQSPPSSDEDLIGIDS